MRDGRHYQRNWELDFIDNIEFVSVFELDDITRGIGELDFFDNIALVLVCEVDHITGGIGELDFIKNI